MEQALMMCEKSMDSAYETEMINFVNAHSDEMKKKHSIEAVYAENRRLNRKLQQIKQKKASRKVLVKNIFKTVFYGVCLAFFAWVMLSWFNVVSNNMSPEGVQFIWDWNFFKVFFKG